jgi:uncharacterized protein YfkK (UPF0435 family)
MSVGKHPETIRNEAQPDEVNVPIVTQPVVDPGLLKSNADNEEGKTQVKRLVKLKHLSPAEKQKIVDELKRGIDNPYFKLSGKNSLRYKDKAYAKRGSKRYGVFEKATRKIPDSQRQALNGGRKGAEGVPEATQIKTPAASQAQEDYIEQEARPDAPIPRGKLNLNKINRIVKINQVADDGVLDPEFFNGVYGGSRKLNLVG